MFRAGDVVNIRYRRYGRRDEDGVVYYVTIDAVTRDSISVFQSILDPRNRGTRRENHMTQGFQFSRSEVVHIEPVVSQAWEQGEYDLNRDPSETPTPRLRNRSLRMPAGNDLAEDRAFLEAERLRIAFNGDMEANPPGPPYVSAISDDALTDEYERG